MGSRPVRGRAGALSPAADASSDQADRNPHADDAARTHRDLLSSRPGRRRRRPARRRGPTPRTAGRTDAEPTAGRPEAVGPSEAGRLAGNRIAPAAAGPAVVSTIVDRPRVVGSAVLHRAVGNPAAGRGDPGHHRRHRHRWAGPRGAARHHSDCRRRPNADSPRGCPHDAREQDDSAGPHQRARPFRGRRPRADSRRARNRRHRGRRRRGTDASVYRRRDRQPGRAG